MKISCPNPSCCQALTGLKALMGRRFSYVSFSLEGSNGFTGKGFLRAKAVK